MWKYIFALTTGPALNKTEGAGVNLPFFLLYMYMCMSTHRAVLRKPWGLQSVKNECSVFIKVKTYRLV